MEYLWIICYFTNIEEWKKKCNNKWLSYIWQENNLLIVKLNKNFIFCIYTILKLQKMLVYYLKFVLNINTHICHYCYFHKKLFRNGLCCPASPVPPQWDILFICYLLIHKCLNLIVICNHVLKTFQPNDDSMITYIWLIILSLHIINNLSLLIKKFNPHFKLHKSIK